MEEFINNVVGLGVFLMQIAFLVGVGVFIYVKKTGKVVPSYFRWVWYFVKDNSLLLALVIVTGSTIGSLYYSYGLGYASCDLCWFQRAMIYPQVVILGVAFLKKNKEIFDYVIGLNVVGFIIGAYQYYFQMFGNAEACPIGEVSCFSIYVLEMNYITIPMMSLSVFVLVGVLTYIWKYYDEENPRIE